MSTLKTCPSGTSRTRPATPTAYVVGDYVIAEVSGKWRLYTNTAEASSLDDILGVFRPPLERSDLAPCDLQAVNVHYRGWAE